MGFEYQLRVTAPDEALVEEILRELPRARSAAPRPGFDIGGDANGWPDASVAADESGAYFVHYGGVTGHAALEEVVAALAGVFGMVTVEEL